MAITRTDAEKRQHIMEQARNHLKRASDPKASEAERELAQEAAARLIRRHDLDVVKLAESDDTLVDMFVERRWVIEGGYKTARKWLASGAIRRTNSRDLMSQRGLAVHMLAFGSPAATEFAEMLYLTLEMQMFAALRAAQKSGEVKGKAAANSFALGWSSRVHQRLLEALREEKRRERDTEDSGTALVLVRSQEEAFHAKYPRVSTSRQQVSVSDRSAYAGGAASGARADISGGRNNLRAPSRAALR